MTNTTEYLQRQLVDMIELAKHGGTNAVEFVQAQAPDLVRQIILWEIWSNAINAARRWRTFLLSRPFAIAGPLPTSIKA